MPQGYLKIRDRFRREGMSMDEAKKRAAKIWNSQNPQNPVGRNYEQKAMAKALRKRG